MICRFSSRGFLRSFPTRRLWLSREQRRFGAAFRLLAEGHAALCAHPLKTVGDVTIYEVAKTAPHAIALVSARGSVEYRELAEKSRRFADALRNRVERGARVAIVETDPAAMLVAALGAFEAATLCFLNVGAPPQEVLEAFVPDLVIGAGVASGTAPIAAFDEIMVAPGKERSARPDFRMPILAMAMPGGRGEVLHNHRSLTATAISVGGFFMMAEAISVVLLEPPTSWFGLALALGALARGATIWAGWSGRRRRCLPTSITPRAVGVALRACSNRVQAKACRRVSTPD